MKPALRQVATVTRIDRDGKTITGPAHWFFTDRVKASDIAKHGSYASARAASQSPAEAQNPHQPRTAFEARGGKASS